MRFLQRDELGSQALGFRPFASVCVAQRRQFIFQNRGELPREECEMSPQFVNLASRSRQFLSEPL